MHNNVFFLNTREKPRALSFGLALWAAVFLWGCASGGGIVCTMAEGEESCLLKQPQELLQGGDPCDDKTCEEGKTCKVQNEEATCVEDTTEPDPEFCDLDEQDACEDGKICLSTEGAPEGKGTCTDIVCIPQEPETGAVREGSGCEDGERCQATSDGRGECVQISTIVRWTLWQHGESVDPGGAVEPYTEVHIEIVTNQLVDFVDLGVLAILSSPTTGETDEMRCEVQESIEPYPTGEYGWSCIFPRGFLDTWRNIEIHLQVEGEEQTQSYQLMYMPQDVDAGATGEGEQ
ncbi:MAG: hypothetical protein FWG75_04410 [Cystobacterineae bacterium]|nr:hypothetical protein [Cystobacterineae bacterium]